MQPSPAHHARRRLDIFLDQRGPYRLAGQQLEAGFDRLKFRGQQNTRPLLNGGARGTAGEKDALAGYAGCPQGYPRRPSVRVQFMGGSWVA